MIRRGLPAVLGFLALGVLLAGCGGTPTSAVPSGSRPFAATTSDGVTVRGFELGEGARAVVLSHGANGTKEGFISLAEAFADAGWRAVAYDARGVGDSTGERGGDRRQDLQAVTAVLRDDGVTGLVLVGGSMGAGLSLAMARPLHADAVVSGSGHGAGLLADHPELLDRIVGFADQAVR